jgi:N,N'-diacetyllegionaminate synthase
MSEIIIIAEIGQAHEGSLGITHSYIDALKDTGVDIIKFQTHIAEAESSEFEPFRINFSLEDKTRYDYWKRMEFTEEEWKGIKVHCEEAGFEFLSSPFSVTAVELLEKIDVKKYKIGSGETNNLMLLERIARTHKEVYISTGLSDFQEINNALRIFAKYNNKISILQCTTAYPTKPNEWGLNLLHELSETFKLPVGFSDHSGNIYACLAAVALGAKLIEFHVTFDKMMFGPDSNASLTCNQVKTLVEGIRQIEESLSSPITKNKNENIEELRKIFGKSLAVNKTISKGSIIKFDDLETKKPKNYGIDASEYENIIGRKLKVDKNKWDFINYFDFENE